MKDNGKLIAPQHEAKRMCRQSAYVNAKGEPSLLDSLCVFADILGFRERVRGAALCGRSNEAFEDFRSTWECAQKELEPTEGFDPRKLNWSTKSFSDCVVVALPLCPGVEVIDFEKLLHSLGRFQLALASRGYFLRGGLTRAELYAHGDVLYGEALLDAWDIEREVAVYPRIILAQEVIQLSEECAKDDYAKGAQATRYKSLQRRDPCDQQTYLDYLGCTLGPSGHVEWEILQRHREHIARGIAENKDSRKVAAKYQWLARYHNSFCDELRKYPDFAEFLLVTT